MVTDKYRIIVEYGPGGCKKKFGFSNRDSPVAVYTRWADIRQYFLGLSSLLQFMKTENQMNN